MTEDRALLRYSDRQALADGSFGPLRHTEVPDAFRVALAAVIDQMKKQPPAGQTAYYALTNHFRQHFGLREEWPDIWLTYKAPATQDVLDFLELLIEEATKKYVVDGKSDVQAWWDIELRLNRLLLRHRFGYRLSGGVVRRVGSMALDERVIEPALQAVHRPGWEEAERSFREALHHQRGGLDERDDALTSATAALEAALKAAGMRGDRLSALAKSLRNSDLVPGQLKEVPEALDTLLKRSGALRDPFSDAHGKAPGADDVPSALVDLSIYWTGAFINYLAETFEKAST